MRSTSSAMAIWLPVLCAIGFVLLAGAIYYVWQNPVTPEQIATSAAKIRALDDRLQVTDSRVSRIEQMPAPPSASDLGKVSARIDALEGRIGDQTRIATRIDQAGGRIEALTNSTQASMDGLKQQLDAANTKNRRAAGRQCQRDDCRSRSISLVPHPGCDHRSGKRSSARKPARRAAGALARFAEKPPPTEKPCSYDCHLPRCSGPRSPPARSTPRNGHSWSVRSARRRRR